MDRGMACCCYEIGSYLRLKMTASWQHCAALWHEQTFHTHTHTHWATSAYMHNTVDRHHYACAHIYLLSITCTWPKAYHGYTCNFMRKCVFLLSHSNIFVHSTAHIHNYADTHMCMARLTHTAFGAQGHYFWCDVQQLEHAGVLYSSTGTAADQRKSLCVCVRQFMICTVRRLWIHYLIIIFQCFHLFNLHNMLLLHSQLFSCVCVFVVCSISVLLYVVCSDCLAYLNLNQTVEELKWEWTRQEKRGKGRRWGVRGWLVWSQDGARWERKRGQTANQL